MIRIVSKCGGIPMLPDENMYKKMCETLDEKHIEVYKRKVEKFYKKFGIIFPWDTV